MPEKLVFVGVIPDVAVIGPDEQITWISNAGHLKIEFDPNRCPFLSNVFQAPSGVRLQSGASRAGTKPGAYKYSLFLNEMRVGTGEVLLREN